MKRNIKKEKTSMPRFTNKKQFKKENLDSLPNNKPVVYEIHNSRGTNIYTGTAKRGRVKERLKEHFTQGSDPIKEGKSFRIKQMESIKNAQKDEERIIKREKPRFNK